MSGTERRFSTGSRFLDNRIDGGLNVGGLFALTAPPISQSELLLREFIQANATLYVSMVRPSEEVHAWASVNARTSPELTVVERTPDELLSGIDGIASEFTPESLLIIDPANAIETAPRDQYLAFLNDLKQLLLEADGVGVLHCMDLTTNPPRRGLTLTRADQIWQLQVHALSRDIKCQLLITKARNGRALSEPIDLILTDGVYIDNSRNI